MSTVGSTAWQTETPDTGFFEGRDARPDCENDNGIVFLAVASRDGDGDCPWLAGIF